LFTIPGLLFIDTPGHAAFTSLRKRGGALADIAILVVDINEGFKPQTKEAIEILRSSKTPFIIAANKIDLISGYNKKQEFLLQDIQSQSPQVITSVEKKMYEIVGELHENFQMNAERFDRVDDYTQTIAIVPCSAMQKIGIAELLMVVTGMAQKYLEDNLEINVSGPAKGTVLEVKETKGLGFTIDAIIYDGTLKVNDTIVIGSLNEPIVTKVRALLEPAAMSEMRDKKSDFINVKEVSAATGVKIAGPYLDGVTSGMPIVVANENLNEVKEKIQSQIEDVLIETEDKGIIVKADSIGSLEALLQILKEENISVAKASVGSITKKDIAGAESSFEKEPLDGVIIGFNVANVPAPDNIKILTGDIIYQLLDDLKEWREKGKERLEAAELKNLLRPCKLQFMKNHTFRQSHPAIIGVDILQGVLKSGVTLMKEDGSNVGMVKEIKSDKDNLSEAEKGKQVAISLPGVTVGRQINEGDILISALSDENFRQLKKLKKYLKDNEIVVMKEIAVIMRKQNPVWGV